MSKILTKCRSVKKIECGFWDNGLCLSEYKCSQQYQAKETNLERIRNMGTEDIAEYIAKDCYNLMDKICLEVCPEQDCEAEDSKQCIKCVEKWLRTEVCRGEKDTNIV